jgi:hypothetical protein
LGSSVQSTLPAGLTGVAASCTFAGGSGTPTCVVNPSGLIWTGDIPAASMLTINYQVQVGAGVAPGTPLCIDTAAGNDLATTFATACTAVDCPPTAAPPTSVDLRLFRAIGLADRAVLVWETASEAGTLGFNVYRATTLAGPWQPVNPALVPGRGAAASGADYVLRDAPGAGIYLYRLEEVDSGGKRTQLATTEVRVGPDATGRRVLLPSAGAWRAGRTEQAASEASGVAGETKTVIAPADERSAQSTTAGEGWITRLARWLNLID